MHKIHPGFPHPKKVEDDKQQANENHIISGSAFSEPLIHSKYNRSWNYNINQEYKNKECDHLILIPARIFYVVVGNPVYFPFQQFR